jgi:hypothetical protein
VTLTIHAKITRTAVYDTDLTLSVPSHVAADAALLRRHLEEAEPGVLSAACTEESLDRLTDVRFLDLIDVEREPPGTSTEGGQL